MCCSCAGAGGADGANCTNGGDDADGANGASELGSVLAMVDQCLVRLKQAQRDVSRWTESTGRAAGAIRRIHTSHTYSFATLKRYSV